MFTLRISPFNTLVLFFTAFVLASCGSVRETPESAGTDSDFFDPSVTVVTNKDPHRGQDPDTHRIASPSAPTVSPTLEEALNAQQRTLDKILSSLNARGINIRVGSDDDTQHKQFVSRSAVSQGKEGEADVDMLLVQNAHLMSVIEKLQAVVLEQSVAGRRHAGKMTTGRSIVSTTRHATALGAPLTYASAIRMYEQHRYPEAIGAFTQVMRSSTDEDLIDNCDFWIGVSHFNQGQYAEAVPYFRHLMAHQWFEKREATFIMLGQCYEQTGNRQLAKATYERLVELNPVCNLAYVAHLKLAML